MNKALSELQNVDPTEKENAENLCKELEKALESKNLADIRAKKDELQKVAQDISVKAYQQAQEANTNSGNNNNNGSHGDSVDADFSDVN